MDWRLSGRESEDAAHLRRILHLSIEETRRILDAVVRGMYGDALEEVLADGRLDPDEESFLLRLRLELKIPLRDAERMMERARRERPRGGGPEGDARDAT